MDIENIFNKNNIKLSYLPLAIFIHEIYGITILLLIWRICYLYEPSMKMY